MTSQFGPPNLTPCNSFVAPRRRLEAARRPGSDEDCFRSLQWATPVADTSSMSTMPLPPLFQRRDAISDPQEQHLLYPAPRRDQKMAAVESTPLFSFAIFPSTSQQHESLAKTAPRLPLDLPTNPTVAPVFRLEKRVAKRKTPVATAERRPSIPLQVIRTASPDCFLPDLPAASHPSETILPSSCMRLKKRRIQHRGDAPMLC